jgi:hypothetical protein
VQPVSSMRPPTSAHQSPHIEPFIPQADTGMPRKSVCTISSTQPMRKFPIQLTKNLNIDHSIPAPNSPPKPHQRFSQGCALNRTNDFACIEAVPKLGPDWPLRCHPPRLRMRPHEANPKHRTPRIATSLRQSPTSVAASHGQNLTS